MSLELIGILGILLMLILMFLKVPIAISMAIPAFLGIIYLKDWTVMKGLVESIIWEHSSSYSLSTIPMFVLMGELLFVCGISSELFQTFRVWFGKIKGGLGMATIGASALFAAASGSSLANTATMGLVSSKEMLKSDYNRSFVGGTIIAGGTLGVLIPPSTVLIIYGMLTEQSIGQLLIAGIIPGIVLMVLYLVTTYIIVTINPNLAPALNESYTWKDRFTSLKSTIWIILLFIVVIGGMYKGYFSPTEAAGIGASSTLVIALIRRKLTFRNLIDSLTRTLTTTSFIFAIIIMAFLLNYFLIITKIPMILAGFLEDLSLPNFAIFMVIILIYLFLGAIMDAMAMVVITFPIIMPILEMMGLDLIWFGVVMVLIIEMAMITPPIGMNIFVLNGVAKELSLNDIFKGALIYLIPILMLIILLYLYPELALYLPNKMY